jgi:hypothetical protein
MVFFYFTLFSTDGSRGKSPTTEFFSKNPWATSAQERKKYGMKEI